MKTILLSIALLVAMQVNAQSSLVNINEDVILINGISTPVENIMLKGDLNKVKKSWLKFTKKHLQQKMSQKNDVFTSKEFVFSQVTQKRGNLIAYMFNKENEVSLNVAYKMGSDVYLNSQRYPEEYVKFREYLELFSYNYYNDFLPTYIKQKEKEISVLVKEKSKAEKANKTAIKNSKKFNSQIEKNNKAILKMDAQIEKAGTDSLKVNPLYEKQNQLSIQSEERVKQIEYNNGLLGINDDLINTINPKIEVIKQEISEARLTLVEVQSKVKIIK